MAPRHASPHEIAGYMVSGYWNDTGSRPHSWDGSVVSVNLSGLGAAGQALARAALDAWEMVADIRFQETGGGADISFGDGDSGAEASVRMTTGGEMLSAHVNIGTDWLAKYGTHVGGYAFHTFLHEIGHALGLGHTGDYGGGAGFGDARFANDSWQMSLMSYLDQDENPTVAAGKAYVVGPMMADIIAIQDLYGRPTAGPTAGDTTWGVGTTLGGHLRGVFGAGAGSLDGDALTIFDISGRDTIDFSDDRRPQVVSLAGGTFSDVYGQVGNLGIAVGTVIENYVGGGGGDRITGNGAANAIAGGGGHDRVRGGAGNDALRGGDGDDRLQGGEGRDRLEGGEGRDTLWGEGGSDTLLGLGGGDTLHGGSGADTFLFGATAGRDVVLDFQDDVDTLRIDDALWGGRFVGVAQVLDAHAEVGRGAVLLDFGGGRTLQVRGVTSTDALLDDIAFS